MYFPKLLIFSILIYSLKVSGQQLQVVSSWDRSPIEHVAIFNPTGERVTLTDSLGKMDLGIFLVTDTLLFQHPSYEIALYTHQQLVGLTTLSLNRKRIQIDEYVISASKSRENKLTIPNMVVVLEGNELKESTGFTSAEILEGTGNVIMQKTQGGGGSPILRGFEANKILLVVDGVRLNNAIYRNGHLQNSITIDHAILERTEVIFGPTSIMYGSDALGGVIHYYTREPQLAGDDSTRFNLQAYSQYATAMKGKTGHLDFSLGSKHWGFLTSVTYKGLEDIRMGAWRDPTFGDWGKVLHYVDQVNGVDSTLANEDPVVQKNTGYQQIDLLQKIRFTPSAYVDWVLNFQYSTSSDIDRLDMLNDYKGENLQYASWYYGPQDRLLVSLKNVLKKDNRLFTNMTSIVAFQKIVEDRNSRKFRSEELLTQVDDVNVLSLNMDLLKIWGARHRLNYGVEFNYNRVTSQAWYSNIYTGEQQPALTRYPEGGSNTWSTSVYASYKWILNQKLVLNAGTRYNWGFLTSSFSNPLLSYDRIEINHGALTGSGGLVYKPSERWQLNAILSTGFRNPNVDDYGKVRTKDDYVTVPNPDISPEYTYNAELGITRFVQEFMKIELVGYYSYLKDVIVRTAFQLNGRDSMYYDGDYYQITANYNAGEAYIYGVSLGIRSNLSKNILLKGTFNYTRGYNLTDEVPLGHIPPVFGSTSLTYRKNRFLIDTYLTYQGWKHAVDFSPFGEDNEGEAMESGFPSWWTLNLKAGFEIWKHFDFMVAVENIFDKFYKPYASGISAPGRNLILTARFTL